MILNYSEMGYHFSIVIMRQQIKKTWLIHQRILLKLNTETCSCFRAKQNIVNSRSNLSYNARVSAKLNEEKHTIRTRAIDEILFRTVNVFRKNRFFARSGSQGKCISSKRTIRYRYRLYQVGYVVAK